MNDPSLLDALLGGLDLAAVERTADGAFALLASPPAWFRTFFPHARAIGHAVALADRFPYLENFLVDADSVWTGTGPASLRSGLWLEALDGGDASYLEAVAVRANGHAVLLIELSPADRTPLQQLIQRGREQHLSLTSERRLAEALRHERSSLQERVIRQDEALAESTARLDAESARRRLAEARARFLALGVDNAAEMICTADAEFRLTYANRAFTSRFGVGPEALGSRRIRELAQEPAAGEILETEARAGSWTGDLRLATPAGATFPATVRTTRVLDESGQLAGFIFAIQDVSEQVRAHRALARAEEQVRHAVKMEAIGHLAGGVAHDFNNLLTAIIGYCELATDSLAPGDPAAAEIARIHAEADRAATLTRQLLTFSRQQVLEPDVLDLREVIDGIGRLLRRLIGESIRLDVDCAPALWPVWADAGQIEQLVVNLAVNARDAMPDGGTLSVAVGNRSVADPRPTVTGTLEPGDHVAIEVRDTGTGIDAALISRIFEPFFTTKAVSKGTGLGLSVVYGIVKQNNGHIAVRSSLGGGSTFTVYLPRAIAAPSRAPASHAPAAPLGGDETILVVEDEDTLRDLLVTLLAAKGYRVLPAADCDEARAVAERHADPIALLVTDVVLPSGNGRDLAETLVRSRPGLEVLFMSGYTDDIVLRHGVAADSSAFLQKPFLPGVFLEHVRHRLDRRR